MVPKPLFAARSTPDWRFTIAECDKTATLIRCKMIARFTNTAGTDDTLGKLVTRCDEAVVSTHLSKYISWKDCESSYTST